MSIAQNFQYVVVDFLIRVRNRSGPLFMGCTKLESIRPGPIEGPIKDVSLFYENFSSAQETCLAT